MAARSRMRPAHGSSWRWPWSRRGRSPSGLWPRPGQAGQRRGGGGRPRAVQPRVDAQRPADHGRRPGPGLQRQVVRRVPPPGGPGGGGRVDKNVTVYGLVGAEPHGLPAAGVVHQKAVQPEFQETLNLVHPGLPRQPSIPLSVLTDRTRPRIPEVVVTQRNTPALFGDGLIDAVSDEALARPPARALDRRPPGRPQRGEGRQGPRPGRPAGRRPDRPVRLEGGVRHAQRLRQGGLRQRAGPVEPRPSPGHPAGQARPQGDRGRPDRRPVRPDDRLHPRPAHARREVVPADPTHAKAVASGPRAVHGDRLRRLPHAETLGPVAGIYSDLLLHDMGVELESSTGYYGAIIPPPVVPTTGSPISEQPTPGRVADRRRSGASPTRPRTSTTAAPRRSGRRSSCTAARPATWPPGSRSGPPGAGGRSSPS